MLKQSFCLFSVASDASSHHESFAHCSAVELLAGDDDSRLDACLCTSVFFSKILENFPHLDLSLWHLWSKEQTQI